MSVDPGVPQAGTETHAETPAGSTSKGLAAAVQELLSLCSAVTVHISESNGEPAMKVFTTGQVAKICKVAPRTVSKWFDSGRLKGYRIPGSQDRRIPREYLIKFLKEHGMPLGDLEDEAMAKVLIVAQDQVLIENLKRELPTERRSRWRSPPADSKLEFRLRASIRTASSSISRSARSRRCRFAKICAATPSLPTRS